MNSFTVFLVCLATFTSHMAQTMDYDGEVMNEPLELEEITFKMPESCKNDKMEFCFSDAGYPKDIIDKLLENITGLEVANDDVQTLSTEQRVSFDLDDCPATFNDKPIYYIVDDKGNDRVVVQKKDWFEQIYSVKQCDKAGRLSKAHHFLDSTITDYKISCQNKYMDYDFLVLSMEPGLDGNWKMERAKTPTGIPVCCACRYEKNLK